MARGGENPADDWWILSFQGSAVHYYPPARGSIILLGMSANPLPPRRNELMSRQDTALLVVDVQERLLPMIEGAERMIWNIRRLIDAAALLGLPGAATEQYPKGLGATAPLLAERLGEILQKRRFSCGQVTGVIEPVLICLPSGTLTTLRRSVRLIRDSMKRSASKVSS